MSLKLLLFFVIGFLCGLNSSGQQENDTLVLDRLIAASKHHSSVSAIVSNLSDIAGPRLLGTAAYYQSAKWARKSLAEFQIDTTYFQSFDKRYRGWNISSFNMEMTKPNYMHIGAYPLAYTKSTKGVVEGSVVYLSHRDSIRQLKGKLSGKIILLGEDFSPSSSGREITSENLSKEQLKRIADNPDPNDVMVGYHSRRSTSEAIKYQERRRIEYEGFFRLCENEGVIALIEPSEYPYGILHADGNHNIPSYKIIGDIKPIASFVIANEHFSRMVRLINSGITPTIKLNLETTYNYNPEFNVNVFGEIHGSDSLLKRQQVLIGAHLDSWHAGTGAADNAAGCAVMMEAMRLLKASGLRPWRTVKICLWGGEEQVFAGSGAYVEKYVGNLFNGKMKKDHEIISAYFNLDNGAGRIRGIYAQGNMEVKRIFENYLSPFAANGNGNVTIQNSNQTDHELFDHLNIPAFQFIQDPLNYISALHHTNMDVADYVKVEDLNESAILVAYLIYKVAMRDELLPRREFISINPHVDGSTTFFFRGAGNAKSVSLVGNFNNWNMFGTPLAKVENGWLCRLNLKPGKYLYKYIVDGDWTSDPKTPSDKLLRDGKGHAGLTEVIVK